MFIRGLGWDTWYHPAYWVHPKTVADPTRQDYTNYGMSLGDVLRYEENGCPKFQPLPVLMSGWWWQ